MSGTAASLADAIAAHVVEQIRAGVNETLVNAFDRTKPGYEISEHLADSSTSGNAEKLLFEACRLALNGRAADCCQKLADFVHEVANEYGSNYLEGER